MNNIKFRAWDKKFKRYEEDENIFINQEGRVYRNDTGDWCDDRYIVQLSTGELDKNGKEIYEGDILHAIPEFEHRESERKTDVMMSEDLQWQIREPGYGCRSGLPLTWGGWESLEIIGNIYENPELMEAGNE